MQERIETLAVQGSPMEVFLFTPEAPGPHPGLLLAQHLPVGHTGIENDAFTLSTARRFADHGYAVAVPFLFHWWPKSDPMETKKAESRDEFMVADMQAAWELLAAEPDVDADRIGIAGHCWGGRVAWLAACHIPQCRALAVFYGGNIRKALGGEQAPVELAGNMTCPVIGFFGNDDANPGPEDVEVLREELHEAGVPHEFFCYDDAGHAFQNFPAPERYREEASEDAWQEVLGFFARELGGMPPDQSEQA